VLGCSSVDMNDEKIPSNDRDTLEICNTAERLREIVLKLKPHVLAVSLC